MIAFGRARGVVVLGLIVAQANARNLKPDGDENTLTSSIISPIFVDGVERHTRQLASKNENETLRAYREIGWRRDRLSLELLIGHLEVPELLLSPIARLAVARTLALRVDEKAGYGALLRHAYRAAQQSTPRDPYQQLAVETSLLAIAKTRTEHSLTDLGRALTYEGILGDAAVNALVAYPPQPMSLLFQSSLKRSPKLLRLYGRLRLNDAKWLLREQLFEGSTWLKLAAATSLLELQDQEVLKLVESWENNPAAPSEFREFSKAYRNNPDENSLHRDFETVSLENDKTTRQFLEHFASQPAEPLPLGALLRDLKSPNLVTRFQSMALLCKEHPFSVIPLLDTNDRVILRAIEWALPYLPVDSPILIALEKRLNAKQAPRQNRFTTTWLRHPQYQEHRSSTFLLDLAYQEEPNAAYGAEGLAARLTPTLASTVRQLLASPLPWVRAATARGLGRARLPLASGILFTHYEVESDPVVRRAVVFALNRRNSHLKNKFVTALAPFDPDAFVRFFATPTALKEVHSDQSDDPFERGLVRTVSPPPVKSNCVAFRPRKPSEKTHARVMGPLGHVFSVPLDPRGYLLVAGDLRSVELSFGQVEEPTVDVAPTD
jgi:hypothetical protein